MPTYDYVCENCRKSFTIVLSMKEHDTKRVSCPKCHSRRVKQKVSQFFAVTAKKS